MSLHYLVKCLFKNRMFKKYLKQTVMQNWYQKGITNLDFTEARHSEWQWHQLGHMQVCIYLQTDNHASTRTLSFFTGRMPFLPPNQQHQSTEGHKNNCCNKDKRYRSKMPYMISNFSVADVTVCHSVGKSKLVYSSLIFVDNKLILIYLLT